MDIIEKLLTLMETGFDQFATMRGGIQLFTVIGCAALAAITHKKWQFFITKLVGELEKQSMVRYMLRGSNRIAFPMSMLCYLLIARFAIEQFGINVVVLDIFTPLLLSMAAITLAIFILRTSYGPSPALRAWEGFISFFI